MFAEAVGEAIGVDALDPALEDGGHRIPPQRKLQDDRVSPKQFLLLGGDVGGLRAGLEGMKRVEHGVEARGGVARGEIVGVERGLPAHGVQVGYLHGMAHGHQALEHEAVERAVERGGFGVGKYQQDVHGFAKLGMKMPAG